MRLGQPCFIGIVAAFADLRRHEIALEKDGVAQRANPFAGQHVRMVAGLNRHDRIELPFQFGPVGIEFVAVAFQFGIAGKLADRPQPGSYGFSGQPAPVQEFTVGTAPSASMAPCRRDTPMAILPASLSRSS